MYNCFFIHLHAGVRNGSPGCIHSYWEWILTRNRDGHAAVNESLLVAVFVSRAHKEGPEAQALQQRNSGASISILYFTLDPKDYIIPLLRQKILQGTSGIVIHNHVQWGINDLYIYEAIASPDTA